MLDVIEEDRENTASLGTSPFKLGIKYSGGIQRGFAGKTRLQTPAADTIRYRL